MHWLFIAIVAPICWALVNHIDKYLLEKHFKDHGVGSLVLYSSLFGAVMLPTAYLFDRSIFEVLFLESAMLIFVGILTGIAIYMYLTALKNEEASIVVPVYQSIPIFGLFFAWILLQETLSINQYLSGVLIILGSLVLSLEFNEESRLRLKWRPLLFMLISSALYGFYETLFKMTALETSFWTSIFWSNLGLLLFGFVIYTTHTADRHSFIKTLKTEPKSIIILNFASETLTMIGNLALLYALLLAPVALVQLTANFQPVAVLIFGIILTSIFPKFVHEKISRKHLLHKISALAVMLIGSILLYT